MKQLLDHKKKEMKAKLSLLSLYSDLQKDTRITTTECAIESTSDAFHYLYILNFYFLGEDGGYINAVEASSQYTNDKKVEDEADEVNTTSLFAGALRYFLFDPLLLQICLWVYKCVNLERAR